MALIAAIGTVLLASMLTADDRVVLREDFSKNVSGELPNGWTAQNGDWRIENGRLHGSVKKGESTLYFGQPTWRDVAVSADIAIVESANDARWAALLLRDGGPNSPGVQLTARRNAKLGNGLEIASKNLRSAGGRWRIFQTAAAPGDFLRPGSHRLRIEARGEWIRGYFDGQRVFDLPRGDEFGAGRVGFRISSATVEIDNVVVEALDPAKPFEFNRLRKRPLIIAHRGFSHRAPENTLAAYRLAIEAGAELAECDVYLSADRVPVLLHDKTLNRTAGVDRPVGEMPLAELRKLDVGRWKSAEFAGERIPTLVEAIELVKGKLRFVIEIKPKDIEKEVVAAINEAGASPDDVVIFSFQREVVVELHRHHSVELCCFVSAYLLDETECVDRPFRFFECGSKRSKL